MITRRHFVTCSAAAIGASVAAAAAPDETLRSELLLDLALETQPPNVIALPGGDRLIVGVSGGTFQGPKLKGTIVGPGGDWIIRRPDGSSVLDVRIVMLTDDAQKIYATWRGLAHTGADGALVARIVPMFETASARYLWLNDVVSVGVYRPLPGKVTYRVYRIL